ncbi:MAG TPA: NADH-quinone oxidoreductase subunit NuoE [Tepidimicrobium sp.]|nr:NADH-quinone oxidoreductase subunit NuoE [Tepidimicrobium sp.]
MDMAIDIKGDYNDSMDIIERYPREKRYTLAILQDIQRKYDFIPREVMVLMSDYLGMPISDIYSMATFYKALSLKPKGKYIIKLCNGTACHIRGSESIREELETILNISPGETTEDGLFSIEVVNCIGACALAPVMLINEKYYGGLTEEKVKAIIDGIKEGHR